MSITKPATCGTCRRFILQPGSKRYGTCPDRSRRLLCVDRAGCYGHQERAESAPVEIDKQVRMEDLT